MFHIFLLSVVLFYVMFFTLAARYIRQFDDHVHAERKLIWTNIFHWPG